MVKPSQPGYEFAISDLVTPGVADLALLEIVRRSGITQQGAPGDAASPAVLGLLAQLVRQSTPRTCRYVVYPFVIPLSSYQQVLPQNLRRVALSVLLNQNGSNSACMLFEEGPQSPQLATVDELNALIGRSFSINDPSSVLPPVWQTCVPCNAITVANLSGGGIIAGIAIEGIPL